MIFSFNYTVPTFHMNAGRAEIVFRHLHSEFFGQMFQLLIKLFGFHRVQLPPNTSRRHFAVVYSAIIGRYNSFPLEMKDSCVYISANRKSQIGGTCMQPQPYSMSQTQVQARVNEFVRGVYNWMALGLALTGVVAYFVTHNEPALRFVYQARWLFFIGELALVFIISARIQKIQASTATGMFMAYSALNGATLALLLIMFTGETIASTFFICAAMFLALSIYGWTTKRDLTGLGSFLFMGVIGILIASVVNIFIGSYGMQLIISYVGVLVFAGLTAYDTQQIKAMALSQPAGLNAGAVRKGAIIGALKLYLDFILMFQYLLMILGGNRR